MICFSKLAQIAVQHFWNKISRRLFISDSKSKKTKAKPINIDEQLDLAKSMAVATHNSFSYGVGYNINNYPADGTVFDYMAGVQKVGTCANDSISYRDNMVTINRAWNRSARFRFNSVTDKVILLLLLHKWASNFTVAVFILKPLHSIGKVPLNASILYKNQEICNKTNLWKFQLISLFCLWENSKNAFSIFVFILMAGVFVSRDENSLLDLISLIIRKR